MASAWACRYLRFVMTENHLDHQQGKRKNPARYCAAAILLQCSIALSGCGAGGALFGGYDLPESVEVGDAPWPNLADAPVAVGQGVYTPAAPNPVGGLLVVETLTAEAATSAARAEALSGPVVTEAEKRRLGVPIRN
jgi:hypothetical protein